MRSSTFTTYINTREEPGAYAALDKLERVAVQRYGTITRAANEAARAAAGLRGGSGGAGLAGNQARDLKTLADAQRNIAKASSDSARSLGANTAALRTQDSAARRAATGYETLARSLRVTATALNVVQGPLGPLAGRVSAVANAISELTGLRLGLAGLGAAAFAVGRLGNDYTVLQSKLRPFFETQEESNRAFRDSIGIAQRARAPLTAIVDLYGRLAAVGSDVGIAPGRIGRITELATKAATLSGGTNQTREAGLNQFLQGIGSNNLGGDELRSVKENTFALAQAIARGFKNADGSIGTTIGNLKALGAQGELTATAVADALERSAGDIEARYRRLPLTLAQAGTEFQNSLTVLVGRLNESTRFTELLAQGIDIAARNITGLAVAASALVGLFAAPTIVASLKTIGSAIQNNTVGILANRAAAREADAEWIAGYRARLAQHQREQAALRAEQAQIQQNIALLERQRAVAARDIQRSLPTAYTPGGAYTAGDPKRVQASAAELRAAISAQAAEQQRLNTINNALRQSNDRVAESQKGLAAATANVAGRMGLLRTAGASLVAFLGGPWGIAVTAATVALTYLATAQSAAEKATNRNEEAQRSFEDQIDATTGKIRRQIGELERLAGAQQQTGSLKDAQANFNRRGFDVQESILQAISPKNIFGARLPLQRQDAERNRPILQAISDLRNARAGSLENLQRVLASQARSNPGLRAALPQIGARIADFQASYRGGRYSDGTSADLNLRQAAARSRVYNGRDQPGDLEIARGLVGPYESASRAKPKTKAQINAEAAALAAQTDLQRARAAEAKIRANGKLGGETDEQYIARLAEAKRQVDSLAKAESEARKARSAGAVQARREARDARQDAEDAARAKRDGALLELARSNQNPNSAAFIEQRQKILKTYDDEVNAINASRAASSSAVEQQIRDQTRINAAAEKFADLRNNGLAQFSDAPRAVQQAARLIDELSDRVDTFYADQSGGLVLYTPEQLAADTRLIEQGLRRPFNDYLRDRERDAEIGQLILQGREAEAEALRTAYGLYDQIGDLRQEDYELLVRDAERQQHINDLLAQRERLTGAIRSVVEGTRDSFEQFLVDLPNRGIGAAGDFLKNLQAQAQRLIASRITESIFGNSEARVRSLVSGRNSVDQAIYKFNGSIGAADQGASRVVSSFGKVETASDRLAKAFQSAVDRLGNASAAPDGTAGSVTTDAAQKLLGALNGPNGIDKIGDAARNISQAGKVIADAAQEQADVVVSARRTRDDSDVGNVRLPGIASVLETAIGPLLTKLFGKEFTTKIGKAFGQALEGAAIGSTAAGLVLGSDANQTGASIGGAIGSIAGSFIPIPGASQVLGAIGGIIGGLFSSPSKGKGGAITNVDGPVSVWANNDGIRDSISAASKSVQQGISNIADALGAEIGSFSVSIAKYKDSYRVDPSGRGSDGGKYGDRFGVTKFDNNDVEGAVRFAIADAIADGAIKGIRDTTQRILRSGQDLDRALRKAVSFEQVFKDLKARTDPVGFAVDELNRKFENLKKIFLDAGASAQEFADLTRLYDLERADAIESATQQATQAIDQFLKDLVGGSSSPLNKRTTYENAAAELDKFKADITAGKLVDQNDLLAAARNFQDASRNLNGSSASFFADFDALRSLLTQARDNANPTNIDSLPGSPLANDPAVQARLAELTQGQIDATNTQTQILSGQLADLINIFDTRSYGGSSGSSISLLPGFSRLYGELF